MTTWYKATTSGIGKVHVTKTTQIKRKGQVPKLILTMKTKIAVYEGIDENLEAINLRYEDGEGVLPVSGADYHFFPDFEAAKAWCLDHWEGRCQVLENELTRANITYQAFNTLKESEVKSNLEL